MTVVDKPSDRAPGPKDLEGTRGRRPIWLVLLAIYCLGFGLASLARVLIQDPSLQVRVPFGFYQLLMWHVVFGAIAMCLAWLQVWPRLRAKRPRLHRRIGLVYLFGGVVPAGLLAIPVSLLAGVGHAYRMSLFVLAVLWLISAYQGYRSARLRRFQLHRRWMLRSVALTTAIISARPLTGVHWGAMASIWPDQYGGAGDLTYNEALTAAMWTAVVLHLVIVEWIVLRPRTRAETTKLEAAR
ncbi:DUF2306 domain-containing protein [Actinoplanes sp. NPDC051861]|uniref:DUF2306 domain-containing protein n=1 Tax=Actinoplanes sp. NPDC051861 TaxID=3155170 RepID=UPI0034236EC2